MKEAGYFDTASGLKPLMHIWSLAIEEQFYLIYPIIVWAAWRYGLNVLAVIVTIGFFSFALNISEVERDATRAFFSAQTRLWELLAGGVLAYLHRMAPRRSVYSPALQRATPTFFSNVKQSENRANTLRNLLSVIGVVLILATAFGISKENAFPGWWALAPVVGASLLILAGPDAYLNQRIFANRYFVYVGLISYPLYLWHWPILSYLRIVESGNPSREIRLAAVALSFALAWLTYKIVEKPIRFGPKSWIKTAIPSVLLVSIGYIGYNAYERNGMSFRAAAEIASINKFDYPYKHSCQRLMGAEFEEDWCNAEGVYQHQPSVVVIGDSFSNAYSEMLIAYSVEKGTGRHWPMQFGRGQCPSLLDYGPKYCRDITNAVADYIARTPSVHTVVLASNWPEHHAGLKFILAPHKENGDGFFPAFSKTVEHYQGLGKRVVVLLAPPSGTSPRSCILRSIRIGDRNPCDLDVEKAYDADGTYRKAILPYLQERGVDVFDPYEALCDDKTCKVIDGHYVLWSDHCHLSVYGGRYLARQAKRRLDAIFSAQTVRE